MGLKSRHVALVSQAFDPFLREGGSRSLLRRLQLLKQLGCQVSILSFQASDSRYKLLSDDPSANPPGVYVTWEGNVCQGSFLGIPFYQEALVYSWDQMSKGRGSQAIMGILQQHAPDYVITSDEDYFTLLAAWVQHLPGAHLFHALANIQRFSQTADHVRFLRERVVFTNSRYLQTQVRVLLGLDAVIWPSPIELEIHKDRVGFPGGSIGFCAASGWAGKGGNIVVETCRQIPDLPFIVVGAGGSRRDTKLPANLAYWGHIADMDRFYQQIDLLLVPSLVEEAFGRVIVEAAAYGIPTIANGVGGIPEACGDSGVLIDWDSRQEPDIAAIAGQYVREIRRLMDNKDLYRQYSHKALARARQYQAEQTRLVREIYERYIA